MKMLLTTVAQSAAYRIPASGFFALVGLAFGGAMLYEAYSIFTGNSPTISRIVAGSVDVHPRIGLVVAFVVGFVIAALVLHFADVLAIWKPN